jgi:hypothetical protein
MITTAEKWRSDLNCVCWPWQRDAEAAQAGERLPGLAPETALLGADFRARGAALYALLQNGKLLVRWRQFNFSVCRELLSC